MAVTTIADLPVAYVVMGNQGIVYFVSNDFNRAAEYVGRLCKYDWKCRDHGETVPDIYYRIVDALAAEAPDVMEASS